MDDKDGVVIDFSMKQERLTFLEPEVSMILALIPLEADVSDGTCLRDFMDYWVVPDTLTYVLEGVELEHPYGPPELHSLVQEAWIKGVETLVGAPITDEMTLVDAANLLRARRLEKKDAEDL